MNFFSAVALLFLLSNCGNGILSPASASFSSLKFSVQNSSKSLRSLFVLPSNHYAIAANESMRIRHVMRCTTQDSYTSGNLIYVKVLDEVGKELNYFSVSALDRHACVEGDLTLNCDDGTCNLTAPNSTLSIKRN